MRNGIYLFLILFLGSVAFHVTEKVMTTSEFLTGGLFFLGASIVIAYLTTHFKKRVALIPAQKYINMLAIAIFAGYGILTGITVVQLTTTSMTVGAEGFLFIGASLLLLYALYQFYKRDQRTHDYVDHHMNHDNLSAHY